MSEDIRNKHSLKLFRSISTNDLNLLGFLSESNALEQEPIQEVESSIPADDLILTQVKELLEDGYRGIILSGPPGTSKSYYAEQIAFHIVDFDPGRFKVVQFHSSYQYEDFVEGFVPRPDGKGFKLVKKTLLEMCDIARESGEKNCVLIIDELSRCDPSRVFGEILTYLELTKREKPFRLASGTEVSIPNNLIFLATMNPFDRSVDEVDAAFERRFAKIAMEPDPDKLRAILTGNNLPTQVIDRIVSFFNSVNMGNVASGSLQLGQAYFVNVKDEKSLRRLWEHQLVFYFKKAFSLDDQGFKKIERQWESLLKNFEEIQSQSQKTEDSLGGEVVNDKENSSSIEILQEE